jgi:hypothetical protein
MGSNISFTPRSGRETGPKIRSGRIVVALIAATGAGRSSAEPDALGLAFAFGVVAILAVLPDLVGHQAQRRDPLLHAGLDAFRRELDRARRHGRPFALLKLKRIAEVGASSTTGSDDPDGLSLALVGTPLRVTDRAWRDGSDVIVLLPEAGRATAAELAARLERLAPGRFGSAIGIAVFPTDGLTSGALLGALDRDARGESVPHAIGRSVGAPSESADAMLPAAFTPPDDIAAGIG